MSTRPGWRHRNHTTPGWCEQSRNEDEAFQKPGWEAQVDGFLESWRAGGRRVEEYPPATGPPDGRLRRWSRPLGVQRLILDFSVFDEDSWPTCSWLCVYTEKD